MDSFENVLSRVGEEFGFSWERAQGAGNYQIKLERGRIEDGNQVIVTVSVHYDCEVEDNRMKDEIMVQTVGAVMDAINPFLRNLEAKFSSAGQVSATPAGSWLARIASIFR